MKALLSKLLSTHSLLVVAALGSGTVAYVLDPLGLERTPCARIRSRLTAQIAHQYTQQLRQEVPRAILADDQLTEVERALIESRPWRLGSTEIALLSGGKLLIETASGVSIAQSVCCVLDQSKAPRSACNDSLAKDASLQGHATIKAAREDATRIRKAVERGGEGEAGSQGSDAGSGTSTGVGVPATNLSTVRTFVEDKANSTIRVMAFENLQCSDSAAYRNMLDDVLLPKYRSRVAFEHRAFWTSSCNWARQAAIAARFIDETSPELGARYRSELQGNITSVTTSGFEPWLAGWAKCNGQEPAKFSSALRDKRYGELVDEERWPGKRLVPPQHPDEHSEIKRVELQFRLRIPAKANTDSGGIANGIPGRRRTVLGT